MKHFASLGILQQTDRREASLAMMQLLASTCRCERDEFVELVGPDTHYDYKSRDRNDNQ